MRRRDKSDERTGGVRYDRSGGTDGDPSVVDVPWNRASGSTSIPKILHVSIELFVEFLLLCLFLVGPRPFKVVDVAAAAAAVDVAVLRRRRVFGVVIG